MIEDDMANDITEELIKITDSLPLFDTHEHIERDPHGRYYGGDLFDLLKNTFYVWADLISSGMPADLWAADETDDQKKWELIKPYLPNVVASSYYRGLLLGLRTIHGFEGDRIDDSNWRPLNEKIRKAYRDPLWTEKVMRTRTHIERAINDVDGFNMDRSLFSPALKFDYMLRGGTLGGREHIKQLDGEDFDSFDDYVAFLERKLAEFKRLGAIALKTVTPYYRGLNYEDVPEAAARRAFRKSGDPSSQEQKLVEDFAFHFVVKKAVELDLPIQVHTGLLAWNTTYLPHCDPTQLNEIFLRYPGCRFILFHGGYPYADETGVLAKTFPNVYLDLCWLPWISPQVTKHYLSIWLEIIPINKFMWGGDAHRAECVHGHWLLAQQIVTEVLTEKVKAGAFSKETAVRIARGIFSENARRFFKLSRIPGLPRSA